MKLENPSVSDQKIPNLYESIVCADPMIDQPQPPPEIMKYRTLSPYEKEKVSVELFRKEHVEAYLDKKWKRELHNRICWLNLRDLKAKTKDTAELFTINQRLAIFARVIQETRNPFQSLKLDLT